VEPGEDAGMEVPGNREGEEVREGNELLPPSTNKCTFGFLDKSNFINFDQLFREK
jgi:hypothetical protein